VLLPVPTSKEFGSAYALRSVRDRTWIHRALSALCTVSHRMPVPPKATVNTKSAGSPSAPADRIRLLGAVKDDVNAKDSHPANLCRSASNHGLRWMDSNLSTLAAR
jgi:hypothetical protein